MLVSGTINGFFVLFLLLSLLLVFTLSPAIIELRSPEYSDLPILTALTTSRGFNPLYSIKC